MTPLLVAHIVSGSLGILSGFVALYATKGMTIHRRVGTFFVVVMLAMTMSGSVVAITRNAAPTLNIPAAMTTSYLVLTGLLTVRPLANVLAGRALGAYLMCAAFVTGLFCLVVGAVPAAASLRGNLPAFPFLLFGAINTLGAVGDLRSIRAGGTLTGAKRINRHLWRMSMALWIAVLSFFIGQADEFPREFRIMPLLATPVVAVLVTMLYWVWRVRVRKSLRGLFERAAQASRTPGAPTAPAAGSR